MIKPMHFAIEANPLAQTTLTGIARYTRQLALAMDQLARTGEEPFRTTLLYRLSARRHRRNLPVGESLRRSFWKGGWWPPAAPYDCLLCTHMRPPPWPGVPRVVTVHDLYQEVGLGIGRGNVQDQAFIAKRAELLESADRLICVSDATRRDLIRFYPDTASRASVVHLGAEARFTRAEPAVIAELCRRFSLDRPFLLFLGLGHPNKNLPRLLEAYRSSAATRGIDLVIAGPAGAPLTAAEQESKDPERRIRRLGFLDDADLPALYSAAQAFLLPSLHEGFGLPIVEAMRCGTPVLTGTLGACPEVAAGHATLVDPYDVESIATGIERVLQATSASRRAARIYAESKTWTRTAEQTVAVLFEAAQSRHSYGSRSSEAG